LYLLISKTAMKKPAAASFKKDSVKKDSLKKDNPKNQLNSTNLKKLGEVSLTEKIAAASEENSDEEQAAMVLHSSMTGVEKSNAWNQHQNHLKKPENKSLKKEFDSLDKKGKGLATSLFLLKKQGCLWQCLQNSVQRRPLEKAREMAQ
jgi:hypothetical protein